MRTIKTIQRQKQRDREFSFADQPNLSADKTRTPSLTQQTVILGKIEQLATPNSRVKPNRRINGSRASAF
jgi:hypothetical protein